MKDWNDAREIKRMIQSLVRDEVRNQTKNCFRVYRATVIQPPFQDPKMGMVCKVRLVGDQTVLTIPFSSKVAFMRIGDMVLVATTYNSFQNAIVWETYNFRDND